MASSESQIEKIQKHFQVLTGAAASLNAASDELTQAVGVLDEALKKLNIGLTTWVTFRSRGDDLPEYYDLDQIGYCKINGVWGVGIRRIWGDEVKDRHNLEGPWLFVDSAREMRIQAVDKLAELVEALSKQASETQRKLEEKTKHVKELTDAICVFPAKGISAGQVSEIRARVTKQQKFLGELLEHAHRWEREGDKLTICFAPDKHPFREMIESRDALLRLSNAAKQVLEADIEVSTRMEKTKSQPFGNTRVPR